MKLKEKIKNLSTKSLLLILGIVIGAGISVVYASVSWKGTSKISKAISENRVAKPSELQEIKDNLDFLHPQGEGFAFVKGSKIIFAIGMHGTNASMGNIGCNGTLHAEEISSSLSIVYCE